MPALDIREIGDDGVDDVAALWKTCGLTRPWNDPHADIRSEEHTSELQSH